MSIYGAVANGVREFRAHQLTNIEKIWDLSTFPEFPGGQADLTEIVLRMDRHKQYIEFANSAVEEILKNLSQLQP